MQTSHLDTIVHEARNPAMLAAVHELIARQPGRVLQQVEAAGGKIIDQASSQPDIDLTTAAGRRLALAREYVGRKPAARDRSVVDRAHQRAGHGGGRGDPIRFLNAIEREIPTGKAIRVLLDIYATHKHHKVKKWLLRHPRWSSRRRHRCGQTRALNVKDEPLAFIS